MSDHPTDKPTTPAPPAAEWSPSALSRMARSMYVDGSWLLRQMQTYRPYICPFEVLLKFVPPGSTVLDVGCGGGLFLGLLHGCGVLRAGYGFDTSGAAIDVAVRMAGRLPPGPAALHFERRNIFQAADAPPGTIGDGPYDVVTLVDVMHHIPGPLRDDLVHFLVSRVRPGGRLIYKDMVRRPRWRAAANTLHDLVLARQWVRYSPVERVERDVTAAGLRLVHAERLDRLWYGHELRVFDRPAD